MKTENKTVMRAVLYYHGTEYYLLKDLLKQNEKHQYIFQRKDIAEKLFSFHGNIYITEDTWYQIEEMIKLDEEYYSTFDLRGVFDYDRKDFENVVIRPLKQFITPLSINNVEYFERTSIDEIGTLSGLYSKICGEQVIFGNCLVRYHNSQTNRLYHKGNLYISEYHLQFIYPKRLQMLINNKLCIRNKFSDVYVDFSRRCIQSTEIDYFDNYFDGITRLPETRKLLRSFYIMVVNKSTATYREQTATYLLEKLYYLFSLLHKELYSYTFKEVEDIILADPNLSGIKDIVHLLNYAKKLFPTFIPDVQGINVKAKNMMLDFDGIIFSAEEFANIYDAAIDISRHVEQAYNDSAYAQYWLYILLMLSNFVRTSDVTNLPILDLRINYEDGYFCDHDILPEEAEEICNLYATKARNQLIGKNKEHKHIYIMEDQKAPLAIALVIVSHHAKIRNLNKLFSMKQIGSDRIYNKLGEPFASITNRKMNYTLATFFEETGSSGGQYRSNVYKLLSIMRSHRMDTPLSLSDTTLVYIKAANTDMSVSQMSYHAFQRGAFGWLYHILLVLAGENFNSIEEETTRIKELNQKYLPEDLEQVSDFVLNETDERRKVLDLLSRMQKDSIKTFLNNMGTPGTFKNTYDLPCIFGKNCPKPGMDCIYCPLSIKTIHSVYIYKDELNKIMTTLENSDDDVVIKKNIYLLYKILRVFQDLRREYGKEYVGTFIDMNEIRTRMENLPVKHLNILLEAKNDKRIIRGKNC